jgi:hypothetical protein
MKVATEVWADEVLSELRFVVMGLCAVPVSGFPKIPIFEERALLAI